jgi:hypothetical protein
MVSQGAGAKSGYLCSAREPLLLAAGRNTFAGRAVRTAEYIALVDAVEAEVVVLGIFLCGLLVGGRGKDGLGNCGYHGNCENV